MKANAPEKIYLVNDDLNIKQDWYRTKQVGFETTEYIRVDVFTEKVEKFLEMLGCGFTITDNITHTNYGKEQLIEDFKNYTKEE